VQRDGIFIIYNAVLFKNYRGQSFSAYGPVNFSPEKFNNGDFTPINQCIKRFPSAVTPEKFENATIFDHFRFAFWICFWGKSHD